MTDTDPVAPMYDEEAATTPDVLLESIYACLHDQSIDVSVFI
jgi:hypothetical protein